MTSSIHDIPGDHVERVTIPAHAAATATESHTLFVAPFACQLVSVAVHWGAAITGTATNYTNVNLVNRGTDGAGTTELANIDYLSGTDATSYDAVDLYSPATPLALAAGTIISLDLEKVATGLALPNGQAVITYRAA